MPPKPLTSKGKTAPLKPVGPTPKAAAQRKTSTGPAHFEDLGRNDTTRHDENGDDDNFSYEPVVVTMKPPDQLVLTEKELDEEMPPRVLTASNPQAPRNIALFSFKEKQYKRDDQVDQMVIHFSMDGWVMHLDTDEAKMQLEALDEKRVAAEKAAKLQAIEAELGEGGDGDEEKSVHDISKSTLRNQFNFSERAAQTFNNPVRERGIATEPPPTFEFSRSVTQWEIYDTYMEDIERLKLVKEKVETEEDKDKKGKAEDPLYSASMKTALKIMERMVNQNAEDEIFFDYKYWEDQSDQFREGEGTLLPLWRFSSERTKRKQVTAIAWNSLYTDMFAVGFGSYDFTKQGPGLICCYSLKNTSHPEYMFTTESGVMSLDFHPQHAALLAVGLYDGTVLVYDVRNKHNRPIYQSTVRTNKHTDPVWQVFWQEEDLAKNVNFFSVSSDGRVTNWVLMKNKLEPEEVMELKLLTNQREGDTDEETSLCGLAGGMCFDFNRFSEHLFIVGTEEGKIHKCSKAYSGQYLETYEGHHMAVYTVKWNPFHPRVFISASADWTVKIWDHNVKFPIMSFDLSNAVGDVSWSPYSSTVFSAVTSDGRVHVYDLHENKHEPLCPQKVVKRSKLTHVAFNPKEPILLVGDDRGGVNCLKLSPNLRKKAPGELPEGQSSKDYEISKMEALLSVADKAETS
eukprot:GILI01003588.1.p1 GENE.GILI01003588.1~~GILI01003588.1.p1  ORF type:complete len:684 (+),score=215.38 GILI01003588.1:90-2141(+)